MGWSNAAWIWGVAAIVIPILLHLRDRHPPEVVRVGSVADLAPAAAVQRRRRLDDIPLLLLRCLIVVLAATLMAGPQTDDRSNTPGTRVAVLTPDDTLATALTAAGIRVAMLPASPHPWTLAAWADTMFSVRDTILLGPAAAPLHAGVRPVLAHTVIALGDAPAGLPPAHRIPRTDPDGEVPARRRDQWPVVWWLLLVAIAIERASAARVRA